MIIKINRERYDITIPTTCHALKKLVGAHKSYYVTQKRGHLFWDHWDKNVRLIEGKIEEGDVFTVLQPRGWFQAWEVNARKATDKVTAAATTKCRECNYYDASFEHWCADRVALLGVAEARNYPEVKGPGNMRGGGQKHWQGLVASVENPMIEALYRQVDK